VNLGGIPEDGLLDRCARLQAEMVDWVKNGESKREDVSRFDGTFAGLIRIYLNHPDSSYHKLKHASRHPYDIYCGKLSKAIGKLSVANRTGLDVMRWHETLRKGPNRPDRLGAATMALTVLKSAVTFGAVCGLPGCKDFLDTLKLVSLPRLKPRQEAPDAKQIERARAAAHADGHPRAALAYALQFETTLRQWDVIGQWFPLDDPRPSSVLCGREKWIGLTWAHIDENLCLSITPTKTERTTAARVKIDLKNMPMVIEELAKVPVAKRVGPMIVNVKTGLPYRGDTFAYVWRRVRVSAEIPKSVWNRDLRAGGITEGGQSGARLEDRAKMAAHANTKTTAEVYDRDILEASRRVSSSRKAFRENDS
jgi:hypothetical protein